MKSPGPIRRAPLLAAFALGLDACGSQPAPASPAREATPPEAPAPAPAPSSSSRAAAFPPGECARLMQALVDVATVAPAAELRATTPEPQMEEAMHRLERVTQGLERLRDTLGSPVLASEANRLMMATAHLQHQTATLFGLTHLGRKDLEPLERSLNVAGRQQQLAVLSARARCEDEPSRDQSAAWKGAAIQAIHALETPIRACMDEEKQRPPDFHMQNLTVQIHVANDGRVTLAGPVDFDMFSGYSADLVHCVVRVIEQTTFPRPEGKAILLVPFGRSMK